MDRIYLNFSSLDKKSIIIQLYNMNIKIHDNTFNFNVIYKINILNWTVNI